MRLRRARRDADVLLQDARLVEDLPAARALVGQVDAQEVFFAVRETC